MSPETEDKLKSFVTFVNVLHPHPLDWDRWHDFVILAHREHLPWIDTDVREWLDEHTSWPEERKRELATLFDREREVLSRYDAS